jgi:hypothetical protein
MGIATVTGRLDMAAVDPFGGFRTELAALGLHPAAVAHADFSIEGGRRAMRALLDAAPDLDGAVVANDLMALGAPQELDERGRRVPDDVAVVGFDDIPLATAASPPPTTVRQPMAEMGRTMAAALLEMTDDGSRAATSQRTPRPRRERRDLAGAIASARCPRTLRSADGSGSRRPLRLRAEAGACRRRAARGLDEHLVGRRLVRQRLGQQRHHVFADREG